MRNPSKNCTPPISRRSFEDYAHSYEIVLPLLSFYNEMLQEAERFIALGSWSLDVGSGPGMLADRNTNSRIISIDYEYSMLRNVHHEALKADGQALPFKDAQFDQVAALNTLPFIPDYETFFSEAYRVSIYGANLILSGIRRNADMTKVEEKAREDLEPYLDDPAFTSHIERVLRWNKEDLQNNLVNLFSLDEVCDLLVHNSYTLTDAKHIYEGQSYFVVGQKR